ncbi:MAG: class I SAM-dependent methyltransferase [Acidimicrobiales bacterium]|nr:class I SAM-dependent methyltransferase [Acidimicrobiales bacterium]
MWNTELSCYRFLAQHVETGWRTLETGAGISTVLFAAWGCHHLAITPDPSDAEAAIEYCRIHSIDVSRLRFDLRPSEKALPELPDDAQFDVFLIDGAHSFPLPTIDWFYGGSHVRRDGLVVLDDLQLPAVWSLAHSFLEGDNRWEKVGGTSKWRAYRRRSEGTLAEHEADQPFYQVQKRATQRWKERVAVGLKRPIRRVLPGDG